jgi:hypothetical protein
MPGTKQDWAAGGACGVRTSAAAPKAKSVPLEEAVHIGPYALKVTARFYVRSAHTGRCRAQNKIGAAVGACAGCEQALGRRPAYAVNVGRAAYFVYRPPGDLSWRGSAVFV